MQSHTSYNKAARLKGKLPQRLGAKIKEDFTNGLYDKRYQVTKKQLSVDTLENRFNELPTTYRGGGFLGNTHT
ncbi:DUF2357 domain-containing protein [Psychrobacter sp. LV10R520-6]|uniref:DUF2357 domain-containing protein n=1 Tax=Psychrobacter sp. LV10R520-6 TaxID=1415574 RepID=UPI002AA0B5E6|nr:DUF2357 domain-containing protein [Psychrobacter sp. LV10R520-6]